MIKLGPSARYTRFFPSIVFTSCLIKLRLRCWLLSLPLMGLVQRDCQIASSTPSRSTYHIRTKFKTASVLPYLIQRNLPVSNWIKKWVKSYLVSWCKSIVFIQRHHVYTSCKIVSNCSVYIISLPIARGKRT